MSAMRAVTLTLLATCALSGCGGTAGTSAAPAPAPRPAGDPASVRYATGPARFRFEAANHTVQEVMGNIQELQFTQTLLLSTSLTEGDSGIALAVTVDSLSLQGTVPGLDPAALAVARGQTFHARFTPQGYGLGVSSPDTANAVFAQVARAFREFLPRLPSAPLVAGFTWVDTVSETQALPGGAGQTSTRSVRQSRVVGWEDRDGVRAVHLAVTATFEISGTGETQGQPLEITGTGQAAGDRWVSATGQYLGGTSRDSTNLVINLLNVGITVPVRQIQNVTVTRLP
jgi:hypothetical protein